MAGVGVPAGVQGMKYMLEQFKPGAPLANRLFAVNANLCRWISFDTVETAWLRSKIKLHKQDEEVRRVLKNAGMGSFLLPESIDIFKKINLSYLLFRFHLVGM